MAKNIRSVLKKATKTVMGADAQLPVRQAPLPAPDNVLEVDTSTEATEHIEGRKTTAFSEITVKGSRGTTYRIAVPTNYMRNIPRKWEWTPERYQIAGEIASGISIRNVAEKYDYARITLYGWLEHPEFREHVDGLIMESGMANRRERIATLSRLTDKLIQKIDNELDSVKLNDKALAAVLNTIGQYSKHLAQEKEEFVESSKVDQTTNISGTVGVATVNVDAALNSAPSEEREKLAKEFNELGDAIIRSIVGE